MAKHIRVLIISVFIPRPSLTTRNHRRHFPRPSANLDFTSRATMRRPPRQPEIIVVIFGSAAEIPGFSCYGDFFGDEDLAPVLGDDGPEDGYAGAEGRGVDFEDGEGYAYGAVPGCVAGGPGGGLVFDDGDETPGCENNDTK